MNREKAERRWRKLKELTVARGATKAEARLAKEKATELDSKWGFSKTDTARGVVIVTPFFTYKAPPGSHGHFTYVVNGRKIEKVW